MLEWRAQKNMSGGKATDKSNELGFRQRIMESPSMRMYMGHYEKKVQRSTSEEKQHHQCSQLQQESLEQRGQSPEAADCAIACQSMEPISSIQADIVSADAPPPRQIPAAVSALSRSSSSRGKASQSALVKIPAVVFSQLP